jgi:TatD DNase family protein
MLVDSHCHLDFPEFDSDRDEVIKRAKDTIIVLSCVEPDMVEKSLGLARRYGNVYCTLGFGAAEADDEKYSKMVLAIRKNKDRIVGVGEVGLDYYWTKDDAARGRQRERFQSFIELSRGLKLPLVVHSRDAETDCIMMLEENDVRAMLHCFFSTCDLALKAAKAGHLISIPTTVLSSKSRQKMASTIPLESMVLETDAPYMSPVRGVRNEPANVRQSANLIAQLKGVDFETVAEVTSRNAFEFFSIKDIRMSHL